MAENKSFLSVLLILTTGLLMTCQSTLQLDPNNKLHQILENAPPIVRKVLQNAEKHRVQILYTQIDRDAQNTPKLTSYGYRLSTDDYFYPASAVKLPAAVLAMEKLNNLNIPNLNIYTHLMIDSMRARQKSVYEDNTSEDGKPSIAHYIKKVFLVSDNDAYNRLFEFLGQQYLNETMWEKGFADSKIIRRLEYGGTPDDHRFSNPFTFYGGENIFYEQPLLENPNKYVVENMKNIRQGIGYMRRGELVEEPIDFKYSNYISIENLQQILHSIYTPEAAPEKQRFRLTEADRQFLFKYMSMLPRESDYPAYPDQNVYYDSYVKYFIFGDKKETMPKHIRIYNKPGQAYGYLIDNAYIADFDSKVEFFLTAVIQVNENQIYNDDTYEYKEIGIPFLAALGKAIYDFELKRKRQHRPDLSPYLPKD